MTVIHLKDALMSDVVDDAYDDVLASLQSASQKGVGFLALDGTEGERSAYNIMNILKIQEEEDS